MNRVDRYLLFHPDIPRLDHMMEDPCQFLNASKMLDKQQLFKYSL